VTQANIMMLGCGTQWRGLWTCVVLSFFISILPADSSSTSSTYNTRFPGVTWNSATWQLSTTVLHKGHYQARMSVANGYLGINVAALGPFFEVDEPVNGDDINGWPLFDRRQTFATIGGFWDSQPSFNGTNYPWLSQYGWDTAISGIPHWSAIVLCLDNGKCLDTSTPATAISHFNSTMDFKRGLMNWSFTWRPTSTTSFDIVYQMFAHKLYVNQALVSLTVTSIKDSNATVINVLNGDGALRTSFVGKGYTRDMIYSAVSPKGVHNVTGYVYAGMEANGVVLSNPISSPSDHSYLGNNQSSIEQAFRVSLKAGKSVAYTKYVGIASSDGVSNANSTAKNAAMAAMKNGYDASLSSHVAEWAVVFPSSSVDDYSFPGNGSLPNDPYIIESAITAVTNPYYLLQNTISQNAIDQAGNPSVNSHSISVCGLGSECYAGQIFWDAEIWMQPGLVAAFPQAAQGIAKYRVAMYPQALANAQTAYQSSKKKSRFSSDAAVFSWTSGRFGNCTATGPCFDYEYHINGDIAQEFTNYWIASGDTAFFEAELFPIYNSIATFFSEILTKNGSRYELTNMTDPDEYANMVDNGGFTMPLIADTLTNANLFRSMFNQSQNSTWETQAQNIFISRNANAGVTLEYTGMNGSVSVKQADVVLNTYPLSYTMNGYTANDSLNDLDYYASRQSPSGPGMTYAIFSIDANKVSPSGCSVNTYQQYSERPYVRAPWFQFSEQLDDDYTTNGGTHPAFPFLTGHGGANQVVLFGYLGLRYLPDEFLHVDPALAPQIPQLRVRNFYWHGWPISAFMNYTHTTLTRLGTRIGTANMTYANNPIVVQVGSESSATRMQNYALPPNGTITISNRTPASIKTIEGNIAQCQSVTSSDPYVQGQFPIAAVDGAASTKWQPMSADKNASITVTLPEGQPISGFYFDWAQAPPVNFSVVLHNDSVTTTGTNGVVAVAQEKNIKISQPFNKSTAAEVLPYQSNTTTVILESTISGGVAYTAKYATLTIIGSQLTKDVTNGTGATVAEWAIISGARSKEVMEALRGPVFAKRDAAEVELRVRDGKRTARLGEKLSAVRTRDDNYLSKYRRWSEKRRERVSIRSGIDLEIY
jgi:trehalose/maltose hydrolase-like predicted phosphorylase